MPFNTRNLIVLMVLLLVVTTSVRAIDQVAIQIGLWSSEQLDITDLQVDISLKSSGLAVTASTRKVQLVEPIGQLTNVRLRCDTLRWFSGQLDCLAGQLDFTHAQWGNQQITFKVQSRAEEESYQLTLNGIRIEQGRVDLQANYQQGNWQADLTGQQIELADLVNFVSTYLTEQQLTTLSQWNVNAKADINAKLSGQQQQLNSADVSGKLTNVGFSDPSGSYVGELLAAEVRLQLQADSSTWNWQQTLTIDDGQAYFEPIFLDLAEQPVTIHSEGHFAKENLQWQVNRFGLEQGDSVQATGQLQGKALQLTSLQLALKSDDVDSLYKGWLQPFFPGSSLSRLQTTGELKADVQWQAEQYQFNIDLQSVSISDEAGRFSIENLDGQLGWTNQASVLPIDLSWQSASVLSLPLGGSKLLAEVSQNQIRFTESLSLPILDGKLSLNDFELSLAGEQGMQWQFQGLLSPVSMDQLSSLMGWPELQGKLSGMIPNVSYRDEVITVDGALLLKIFDGTTVIRDLRLQQPFGSLPQLYANIDISRLDLQTLTSTFDFGNISGKIDGKIHNLRLSNWEPVQFDAVFMTPEKDPGRRRISQRAVNNISQVGGGPSAILSRGFMGLFEDFSYQKIGLSCRLMNSVCQMDGVEPTEQGYYIVKGGGLPPWINVVGFTREVDWPELIARLKAVRHSDGPVIQ
ncbi:hypothetical protein A9E74_01759 [Methylophaga muralis]|uniref:Dicarboxylate transport domain-containing protein n=1 Tax=Methylophaga muralis TaxID=291169 RepID=A0A1E3GR11_9GAMM|nr:hypothetical protein A9E74_01759 [Methylophaga muralis]